MFIGSTILCVMKLQPQDQIFFFPLSLRWKWSLISLYMGCSGLMSPTNTNMLNTYGLRFVVMVVGCQQREWESIYNSPYHSIHDIYSVLVLVEHQTKKGSCWSIASRPLWLALRWIPSISRSWPPQKIHGISQVLRPYM